MYHSSRINTNKRRSYRFLNPNTTQKENAYSFLITTFATKPQVQSGEGDP
jgi:hypothetical protein